MTFMVESSVTQISFISFNESQRSNHVIYIPVIDIAIICSYFWTEAKLQIGVALKLFKVKCILTEEVLYFSLIAIHRFHMMEVQFLVYFNIVLIPKPISKTKCGKNN
ncbi:hypothetical protein ACB098_03G166900 [Castanea mollissima]